MEYERHEFTQPLYGGVNVLRIGDTLVDTGHVAPVCRDAVREALDGPLSGVEQVLHTHAHIDHVGGSQTIDALAELPHVVPEGQPEFLYDYASYLRRAREEMTRLLAGFDPDPSTWDTYFPIREYAEDAIDVTRTVGDGDTVEMGDEAFVAVSTPGHADPHLAFHHEPSGTVLSGDLVDPDGRFQYGPLLGDIGNYKDSLRRLRDLDPDRLVPMHGPELSNPRERIDGSLSNAERTEARLLSFLEEREACFAREFVTDELGVGGARTPFLTLVVYEYCRYLEDRGELSVDVTSEGIRLRPLEVE
ncbi:MBL fold metallo-hydrolase [Natronomonas marina]|jgi:glyoxylase-like metal-dependent hydrolase (beta-lactamase superfamily II)|uniref:MBL fold metallo-hydrolase n=1 Tax=Natronomonas marina TaxID=2961939 RepID=UPI0020C946C4|nr:MBL fold metallo-hydrolase [Natronomonas marina]